MVSHEFLILDFAFGKFRVDGFPKVLTLVDLTLSLSDLGLSFAIIFGHRQY